MDNLDRLSIFGVILSISTIIIGNYLGGGSLSGLFNFSALLIVLGGTLGASLLQTPLSVFQRAIAILPWIFNPPKLHLIDVVHSVSRWGKVARQEGLLGLERIAEKEKTTTAKKGLQLLIDGTEPEVIRQVLESEVIAIQKEELQSAKVFESMGGYAPTVGIIGAVMGLIHVMGHLSDPSQLGHGIATAFVATIYGVSFANLFFIPCANKLKIIIEKKITADEMVIEGIIAISEGENPRMIQMRLMSYLDGSDRLIKEAA